MVTVNGTIYVNNEFVLYINGEEVGADRDLLHNAYNVSFEVEEGKDITFGIDARDWASPSFGGLEFDGRCVGSGWIIAMFSNGVVSDGNWTCFNYNYGPVNWNECVGSQTVRDTSLNPLPFCAEDTTPLLEGCRVRLTSRPEGWAMPEFDDSRWDYAIEYNQDSDPVNFGPLPTGCEDNTTYVSPDVDAEGVNFTCQNNIDWGNAKFIWRTDLDLDNYILCRYTLKLQSGFFSSQNHVHGCSEPKI